MVDAPRRSRSATTILGPAMVTWPRCRGGLDVLVEAEEVGWVVGPLDIDEAVPVVAERNSHKAGVVAESREVEVGLAGAEGGHCLEQSSRPVDVGACLFRVGPVGEDLDEERCAAVAAGGRRTRRHDRARRPEPAGLPWASARGARRRGWRQCAGRRRRGWRGRSTSSSGPRRRGRTGRTSAGARCRGGRRPTSRTTERTGSLARSGLSKSASFLLWRSGCPA